jgi:hypothetical protein
LTPLLIKESDSVTKDYTGKEQRSKLSHGCFNEFDDWEFSYIVDNAIRDKNHQMNQRCISLWPV